MDTSDFDHLNKIKKSLTLSKLESHFLYPQEGEVWMCSWGLNLGYEQNGSGNFFSRPAVIIKKFNNQMFLAVPLSTKQKKQVALHSLIIPSVKSKPRI